jgi:hypothetical protein
MTGAWPAKFMHRSLTKGSLTALYLADEVHAVEAHEEGKRREDGEGHGNEELNLVAAEVGGGGLDGRQRAVREPPEPPESRRRAVGEPPERAARAVREES